MSGVEYVVSRITIQYQMSRARFGDGIVYAPYEAHIGYQATSLFETDNHDLVILSRWLQHNRELVMNPCVIIISICLKWYFRLDITSNTLQFSINPIEAYTEPVKALDDQNQSLPIVASISDVSLRLRPNTSTLTRTPIDTYTYYQWDSAGSIQSEAVFRTIGKTQPPIALA